MNWWKPLSFTEARAAAGQPIKVPGSQLLGRKPVDLQAGLSTAPLANTNQPKSALPALSTKHKEYENGH